MRFRLVKRDRPFIVSACVFFLFVWRCPRALRLRCRRGILHARSRSPFLPTIRLRQALPAKPSAPVCGSLAVFLAPMVKTSTLITTRLQCEHQPAVCRCGVAQQSVTHRGVPAICTIPKDFGGGEARTADVTIKHELGHVLGLDYHASTCLGLMKAVNDGSLRMFQTSDIAAICGAGHGSARRVTGRWDRRHQSRRT